MNVGVHGAKSGITTWKWPAISCLGFRKDPDAVLTQNLASLTLLHLSPARTQHLGTLACPPFLCSILSSMIFSWTDCPPEWTHLFCHCVCGWSPCSLCGFNVCPVVAPSSAFASGPWGRGWISLDSLGLLLHQMQNVVRLAVVCAYLCIYVSTSFHFSF